MRLTGRKKGGKTKENEGKSLKTGGKWRNDRKKVRKIVENKGKMEENGGMPGKR